MKGYLKNGVHIFIGSFKKLKNLFLPVYLYDVVFFLLFTASLVIMASLSNDLASMYGKVDFNAHRNAAVGLVQNVLFVVGFMGIVYYAIFLALYSSLKGFIWQRIANLKFSWNFTYKYFQLCLIWISIILTITILLLFSVKREFMQHVLYIMVFLWFHFSTILSWYFTKHQRSRKTIGKALIIGTTKIHKFILPYALSFLVFMVITQFWRLVPMSIVLNNQTATITYVIAILVPVLSWYRIYMYDVLDSV